MKVLSNGMTEIFRAYTRQLRNEYVKAGRESAIKQSPARGFEKVELSKEALALAASKEQAEADEVEEERADGEAMRSSKEKERTEEDSRVQENQTASDT